MQMIITYTVFYYWSRRHDTATTLHKFCEKHLDSFVTVAVYFIADLSRLEARPLLKSHKIVVYDDISCTEQSGHVDIDEMERKTSLDSDSDNERDFSIHSLVNSPIRTAADSCKLSSQWMCHFVQWAKTEIFFFFALFTTGLIFGLLLPKSQSLTEPYATVSNILGYVYFLAWSISFYPQMIQNYSRGTTIGLSLDFQLLNLVGFLCYFVFAFSFYNVQSVQSAYAARHNGNSNKVSLQDLLFAAHAVLITILTLTQIIYYDGRRQRLSRPIIILLSGMIGSIAIYGLLVAFLGSESYAGLTTLAFLYFVSYIKLAISTIKGFPQAYLNFQLKSTEGWSIHNVLLDLVGALLSLMQLLLDCNNTRDWTGISGDPLKFGLSFVTIVFDVIFMIQHFIIYPSHNANVDDIEDGERQMHSVAQDGGWSRSPASTALLEDEQARPSELKTSASEVR